MKETITLDEVITTLNTIAEGEIERVKTIGVIGMLNSMFGDMAIIADFDIVCDRTNHEPVINPIGLSVGDECPLCSTPLVQDKFNRFVKNADYEPWRSTIEVAYKPKGIAKEFLEQVSENVAGLVAIGTNLGMMTDQIKTLIDNQTTPTADQSIGSSSDVAPKTEEQGSESVPMPVKIRE